MNRARPNRPVPSREREPDMQVPDARPLGWAGRVCALADTLARQGHTQARARAWERAVAALRNDTSQGPPGPRDGHNA